jgi:hypothetical protein
MEGESLRHTADFPKADADPPGFGLGPQRRAVAGSLGSQWDR